MLPLVPKSYHLLPKDANCCYKLPLVATSCPKKPHFAICFQKLLLIAQKFPFIAKRFHLLSKVGISCPQLPTVVEIYQQFPKLPTVVQNFQFQFEFPRHLLLDFHVLKSKQPFLAKNLRRLKWNLSSICKIIWQICHFWQIIILSPGSSWFHRDLCAPHICYCTHENIARVRNCPDITIL